MSASLPVVTIFLGIRNVLINERSHLPPRATEVYAECSALFGHKPKYSSIEVAIGKSNLFDDDATNSLCHLIEKIKQAAYSVQIVIYSNFRIGIPFEELKNEVFDGCGFEHDIVDSTPVLGDRLKEISTWLTQHEINQKGIKIFIGHPQSFYENGPINHKLKTNKGLFNKECADLLLNIPGFINKSTSSNLSSIAEEKTLDP